jgi:hypothetical protein
VHLDMLSIDRRRQISTCASFWSRGCHCDCGFPSSMCYVCDVKCSCYVPHFVCCDFCPVSGFHCGLSDRPGRWRLLWNVRWGQTWVSNGYSYLFAVLYLVISPQKLCL